MQEGQATVDEASWQVEKVDQLCSVVNVPFMDRPHDEVVDHLEVLLVIDLCGDLDPARAATIPERAVPVLSPGSETAFSTARVAG
jgi:hypothetical protein